jgi:protein tyrosine phosphatase (PTP) superfamily phosphohydrolase (DUF442 family)
MSRVFALALLLAATFGPAHQLASAHGGNDDHDHGPAMNYHAIDERLVTGGHFFDGGVERVADAGVTVVVDLRDEPPAGQAERLADAGMEWVNVPVAWKDPKPEDFEAFTAAMAAHPDAKILVQCQANYRASAFAFLYRVKVDGVSERKARKDLEAVWKPEGRWGRYIDTVLD